MEITAIPTQPGIVVVPADLIAEIQAGGFELERIFNRLVQGELWREEQHRRRNSRLTSDEMESFVPATPRQLVDEAKAELARSQTPDSLVTQNMGAALMRLEKLNGLLDEAMSAKGRSLSANRTFIRAKIEEAEMIAFDLSQALNDTLEALGQ